MIKHFIAVAVLVVLVTVVILMAIGSIENVLPPRASEQGVYVDRLLGIHLQLIVFLFSLIVVILLYSVVVFRRKPGDEEDGAYFHGHTKLEVLWTVIPLGVVLVLATVGAQYLGKMEKPDPDEMVVNVVGFQWDWRFEYPEYGITSTELQLPLDKQVRFEMTSEDVIHSFWVPEFRIKQDLVPGMTTTLRIRPTEPGQYWVRCAELCGTRHTYMNRAVNVLEASDFDVWVSAEQAAVDSLLPEELGAKMAEENGCLSCHSVDGTQLVGPSWLGTYGSTERLADGTVVTVDDEYLRQSILEPNVSVVEGYPAGVMPQDYVDRFNEEEILALVAYIRSLGE